MAQQIITSAGILLLPGRYGPEPGYMELWHFIDVMVKLKLTSTETASRVPILAFVERLNRAGLRK